MQVSGLSDPEVELDEEAQIPVKLFHLRFLSEVYVV